MASELGQAYVQIIPSAKGIKANIEKELGGEADAAGKSTGGRLGSALKGAIAVAGIGAAIGKAISEGSALQQSIGGIETLFKGSAGKLKAYASQAYKTAGVSANTYMETVTGFSASLLQSLGGDTSKAADSANMAMVDMSDNANKMGTSMGSIQYAYQGFAKQNYTMLDNLKLGYGGTQKEMQRLLSDAGKISGQKYDMSNLNDVYSAIHVIQGELNITGTTSKEAASTLEGSFNSMKASLSDVLGNLALGNDITPSLQALVQTTSTYLFGNLIPAVGNVLKALPNVVVTGFSDAFQALKEKAPAEIKTALGGLESTFGSLQTAFGNLKTALDPILEPISNLGSQISDSVTPTTLLKGAIEVLNTAIGTISGVITTFADGLEAAHTWVTNNQTAVKLFGAAFGILTAAVVAYNISQAIAAAGGVAELASLAATAIGVGALTAVETVAAVATTALGVAMAFLTSPVTLVVLAIGVLIAAGVLLYKNWDVIKKKAVSIWGSIKATILSVWDKIKSGVGTAVNAVKSVVLKIWNAIKTGTAPIWNGIKAVIMAVVHGIQAGVKVFNAVKSFIIGVWNKIKAGTAPIWNGIKTVVLGVVKGIQTGVKVFNTVKSFIIGVWNKIKAVTDKVWGAIKFAIINPVKSAVDKVKWLIDKVRGFFNFKWSLPKIGLPKLPSFHIDWKSKEIFGKSFKYPAGFGITWHAKGGVFGGPSVIGVGEAGPEAVVPLDALWTKFAQMADSIVNGVGMQVAAAAGGGGNVSITLYMWPNGPKAGEWIVNTYDGYKRKKG